MALDVVVTGGGPAGSLAMPAFPEHMHITRAEVTAESAAAPAR
jgi:hypothetical protein